MGMYTELVIALELPDSTPKEITDVLAFMADAKTPVYTGRLPKHPLFECDRWACLFSMSSYYFAGQTQRVFKFDENANAWFLTSRANLKNYNGEIQKFLDWIEPYVCDRGETDCFVGYWRYEESTAPTLIYFVDGKFKQREAPPP